MQRGFGGTTLEPAQPERGDRELTLGPFLLTLIGCGLFALCGLCFVFGYSVGHSHAETSSTVSVPPPVTAASFAQSGSPQSKPTAGQTGDQAMSPAADATDPGATSDGASDASAAASGGTTAGAADPQPAVLRPAVVQQPASGAVQPALSSQPSGVMVQIAAVSHQEDADVLVGALRKRGYAVAARRDPADGLLRVQIGPFANRDEAWAMRQKLLNDGYNAIVQP
jgi:cell division septation protein DedD